MKALPERSSRNTLAVAAITCLILAGSLSAFAVPKTQVSRITTNGTWKGKCCFLFGTSVQIAEPSTIAPVIVTWSTDYNGSNEWFLSGLSVNGGPCTFFGSGSFEIFSDTNQFSSKSFQWVVLPNDGLVQGTNRFQLCGGGAFTSNAQITFGFNTLAVQIGK